MCTGIWLHNIPLTRFSCLLKHPWQPLSWQPLSRWLEDTYCRLKSLSAMAMDHPMASLPARKRWGLFFFTVTWWLSEISLNTTDFLCLFPPPSTKEGVVVALHRWVASWLVGISCVPQIWRTRALGCWDPGKSLSFPVDFISLFRKFKFSFANVNCVITLECAGGTLNLLCFPQRMPLIHKSGLQWD